MKNKILIGVTTAMFLIAIAMLAKILLNSTAECIVFVLAFAWVNVFFKYNLLCERRRKHERG